MTVRSRIGNSNWRGGAMLRGENAPRRVRGIPRLGLPCPDCPAQAGEKCRKPDGTEKPEVHESRKRITTRAYNAEHLQPAKTKTLRKLLQLYCARQRVHVLGTLQPEGKAYTACGIKVNYVAATAKNRLTQGVFTDIHCDACREAVAREEAAEDDL